MFASVYPSISVAFRSRSLPSYLLSSFNFPSISAVISGSASRFLVNTAISFFMPEHLMYFSSMCSLDMRLSSAADEKEVQKHPCAFEGIMKIGLCNTPRLSFTGTSNKRVLICMCSRTDCKRGCEETIVIAAVT